MIYVLLFDFYFRYYLKVLEYSDESNFKQHWNKSYRATFDSCLHELSNTSSFVWYAHLYLECFLKYVSVQFEVEVTNTILDSLQQSLNTSKKIVL